MSDTHHVDSSFFSNICTETTPKGRGWAAPVSATPPQPEARRRPTRVSSARWVVGLALLANLSVAQAQESADLSGAAAVFGAVGLGPVLNALTPVPQAEPGTFSVFVGGDARAFAACHKTGEGWLNWRAAKVRCLQRRPPWDPADRPYFQAVTRYDHAGHRQRTRPCKGFARKALSAARLARLRPAIDAAGVFPMAAAAPHVGASYSVDLDGDGRREPLLVVLALPEPAALDAWKAQWRADNPTRLAVPSWESGLFFLRAVGAQAPKVVGHAGATHFLRDTPATCHDLDGDGRPEVGLWLNGDSELEHALYGWDGAAVRFIGTASFGD